MVSVDTSFVLASSSAIMCISANVSLAMQLSSPPPFTQQGLAVKLLWHWFNGVLALVCQLTPSMLHLEEATCNNKCSPCAAYTSNCVVQQALHTAMTAARPRSSHIGVCSHVGTHTLQLNLCRSKCISHLAKNERLPFAQTQQHLQVYAVVQRPARTRCDVPLSMSPYEDNRQ